MIKEVVASNFQSWELLEFNIESGVTLIDGWNHDDQTPEGSGKSAVVNALCWGLFGKLPKVDSKIDDVIKDGQKHCTVAIALDHPKYSHIIRSRGPNDLSIVDNEGNEVKGKDMKETQTIIESIVSMSFDTFCQTIYFAQNYPKKFISSTQEERGKILSEIQDLQIFDKARKEVMELIKKSETSVNGWKFAKDELLYKIEANNQAIKREQEFADSLNLKKIKKLEQLSNQVSTLELNINTLKDQLTSYEDIKDDSELVQAKSEISQSINLLNEEISKNRIIKQNIQADELRVKNLKNDLTRYRYDKEKLAKTRRELVEFIENPQSNCPTCGTLLKDQDTSHSQKELESIEVRLNELGDYANKLEEQLASITIVTSTDVDLEISKLNEEVTTLKNHLKSIDQYIHENSKKSQIKKDIEKRIDNSINELENTLKQIEAVDSEPIEIDHSIIESLFQKREELDQKLKSIEDGYTQSQLHLNRLLQLKDGFKEVKSYTFNNLLTELTIKTNENLSNLFEVPITLKFTNNDMKIDTEICIDGQSRGFGLLSGGESTRVALSVDLALSDIIKTRTGSNFSLRILDEYFKFLSEESMGKCLKLLEKFEGTTILIEHNSIFKSIVTNLFYIEKNNGVSRLSPR